MQQPDKIPNFDKKESEIATNIDKWMWLFKNLGEAKKMPLFMDSRALKRVFQITEVANLSEEEPMAYEGDPYGNLGRLQAELWRACRLVVDAGIHHKRWTREQAIAYLMEHVGLPETEATTEVERYIVWPGQACAYKIGLMKILELRERAKSALGDRFDLRAFHRVVLQNGSVPLDILEELVDGYIQEYS